MRATLARLGAAIFLIAYMFWFAGGGLWARFTGDDLMNLNFHLTPSFGRLLLSNLTFWTTAYRPMGGVVYAAVYHLAGFHPIPFRVVCFAILIVNLGLVYRLCVRLGGSTEVGLIAALLMSYHAWMVNLYYSTGTVYELLCFAFYVGALCYYVGLRQRAVPLRWTHWSILIALYICALNAKELGVTLPLALFCYECFWQGRKGDFRPAAITALLTVPYVIGKLSGPGSLAANPAYRPALSPAKYLHTFHLYLNVLFYQEHFWRDANTIALVVLMLALAIWLKSRPLKFAWCFVMFSVLPFIFVPHYSGFFMYLPMVGWTLYAATAIAMLRDRFAPKLTPAIPLVVLALVLAPLHARESRKALQVFHSADLPTTEMSNELRRVQPVLPRGARIFFQSDPFPAHTFDLVFLVRLNYADLSIQVGRAVDGESMDGHFDAVFRWEDGRLMR